VTAIVLRGDARDLPLPDESVDLICTSPPYWSLRSYTDAGEHYDGQIGSEATPALYVAALLECTREWVRVLKPGGSIFVNLGDKYAGGGQGGNVGGNLNGGPHLNRTPVRARIVPPGAQAKSLLGLPWRYALACMDELGLILRRDIIWHKANPLPESAEDRCATRHEYLFHLARQPRYFSAVDEIREPHVATLSGRDMTGWRQGRSGNREVGRGQWDGSRIGDLAISLLGKLPGSVWEIPSQPLAAPAHLAIDHFAAFPMELPRRCILGWSPCGVCAECGEGRRPVVDKPGMLDGDNNPYSRNGTRTRSTVDGGSVRWARRAALPDRITGYACACTPYTDHPAVEAQATRREYHLKQWDPAPTRPAVVVDPFGGTGTTALVADVLGRTGVTVDRSADYCRLARWRTTDPGERARAMQVPKPPPVPEGQRSLFDDDLEAS
jgi:DNA modification methylase